MTVDASYLSSSRYGYDFVVATTQASINSGLLAYLSGGKQPVEYICFLADPETGNPTSQITLADLLKETGNVNPFDIPEGTSYDDPRIATLTRSKFIVGVKIQMGLPPGVMPKDLPLVVTLGDSANNVLFNMFCSQFTVIQNSPPSGFGGTGVWNVWQQPSGTPWYVTTRVNLVMQDLDKELNTPYFARHPAEKAAILAQLVNLSASAFSLQQLLLDLDSAVLQSVPTFGGIAPGSNAAIILQKSFMDIYSVSAKKYGQPLISIAAVSHEQDASQLALTGFERLVSPLVDGSGVAIKAPTALQQQATTLDYLCAVKHHPLQGGSTFSWNWVAPADIDNESGIIAINRNVIADFLLQQLLPLVKRSCIAATCDVHADWYGNADYRWTLRTGQTPQTAQVTTDGANVITIQYSNTGEDDSKHGATYAELKINPNYSCDVSFSGTTVTVVQHLWIYVHAQWDSTGDGANVFDKTITDTYQMSVGQNGNLTMTKTGSTPKDDSQDADRSVIVNFFTGINDLVNDIKSKVGGFAATEFASLPFATLQNFIFPGAKVFTYKSASFSQHQDLICEITYVKPS